MTKSNVLSLRSLCNWLGKQPARKTFNFYDNRDCVLAQFFKAKGLKEVSVRGYQFSCAGSGDDLDLPFAFREVAHVEPATFGAAHKMAKALLGQRAGATS
jgi:hypothetical protein